MICGLNAGPLMTCEWLLSPGSKRLWLLQGDLKLTQEQQRYLGAEMRKYLSSIQRLFKERQRLQSMLAVSLNLLVYCTVG